MNTEWLNITLGKNTENKELVIVPGQDRTLNTVIIGAIGNGKMAS